MAKIDALQAIVKKNIRQVKSGRRDLCTIYRNREELNQLIRYLADPFRFKVDYVAAPESIGFMIGSFIAAELGVGFIPIRNGDVAVLSDDDVIRAGYIDHHDMPRTLQVRKSNLPSGSRILLCDDWVESGITVASCMRIIDDAEAELVGVASFGVNLNEVNAKLIDSGLLRTILTI